MKKNLSHFNKGFAKSKALSILLLTSVLSACGGGSSTDNPPPPPPTTKTGSFMQGTVSGLSYTTETHTGLTTSEGTFQYEPNETISFFIGGTQLGETVNASEAIGPLDLVPGSTIPVTGKDVKAFLAMEDSKFGTDSEMDLRHELMNILTFLYSVDSDKIAVNGISIDAQTHAVFTDKSYDLKVRAGGFEDNTDFRVRLFAAYDAGAMASARIIRHWKALDDFAALVGVVPQVYVPVIVQTDYDLDGAFLTAQVHSFDGNQLYSGEQGDRVVEHSEYGDRLLRRNIYPGSNDQTRSYIYDVHGNIARSEYDYDADGISDFTSYFTYDANGNKISYLSYRGGNDTPDRSRTYTYDADNVLTSISYEMDGDGVIDLVTTHTFDANGNLTSNSFDNNADGIVDSIFSWSYDANSNLTGHSYDNNADGTADSTETYTYDAAGNQTSLIKDNNVDGTPEYVEIWTYDINGNRDSHSLDDNGDGVLEVMEMFSYDANGNLASHTEDYYGDGTVEYIHLYTYDAEGDLIESSTDYLPDSTPPAITSYTFDENGNRVSVVSNSSSYLYTYQAVNFLGRSTFKFSATCIGPCDL